MTFKDKQEHLYRAGDAAVSCDVLYNHIWDHAAWECPAYC